MLIYFSCSLASPIFFNTELISLLDIFLISREEVNDLSKKARPLVNPNLFLGCGNPRGFCFQPHKHLCLRWGMCRNITKSCFVCKNLFAYLYQFTYLVDSTICFKMMLPQHLISSFRIGALRPISLQSRIASGWFQKCISRRIANSHPDSRGSIKNLMLRRIGLYH